MSVRHSHVARWFNGLWNWWRLRGKRRHAYHLEQASKVIARLAQLSAAGPARAGFLGIYGRFTP